MPLSKDTAAALLTAHETVQGLTAARRTRAKTRTEIAKQAEAEGATIPELMALLGLSRTGVIKVLGRGKRSTV